MTNRIKLITVFVILCASSANFELIELNEDNWRLMLKGEWMVKFFAPWCPACKSLAPIWKNFAQVADNAGFSVAQVDVTNSPSLSGRFLVTALPTIYHIKDGEFRQYRGSRDGDAFMFFIKQKEWKKVEPISSWKNPDTIHMTILSYFFKVSHLLKDFNTNLREEYGLPTWGAYMFLATATIIAGAALGLTFVCIVDFLYPAKKVQRQGFSLNGEESYNAVDDEIVDDVENENEDGEDDDDENDEENDEIDDEENVENDYEENKEEEDADSASDDNKASVESKSDVLKKSKSSPSQVRRRNQKAEN